MKKAVFAGTFDPFTLGHYDIVKRASLLFDKVVVAVAKQHGKANVRALKNRIEIAELSVCDVKNAEVVAFDGLLSEFAKSCGTDVIIRGLRSSSDFEYERSLGEVYREQNKHIECVYLISSHAVAHISSTLVRELTPLGANIGGYVKEQALTLIEKLYGAEKE